MRETATTPKIPPKIPTSAAAFTRSGGASQFEAWLHKVRPELRFYRCAELTACAAQALDVLGEAAPHFIPTDPLAAETFLERADLPLLGLVGHRHGDLTRAVRGLHAWANGFDGTDTRRFMDRTGTVTSTLPAVDEAAEPPAEMELRAMAELPTVVPVPDPDAAAVLEVPASLAVLETAVACELARSKAAGELLGVLDASRAVLLCHRPDVRRQIAIRTAEACGIAPTVFVRDGATSTQLCDFFLRHLLRARFISSAHRLAAA